MQLPPKVRNHKFVSAVALVVLGMACSPEATHKASTRFLTEDSLVEFLRSSNRGDEVSYSMLAEPRYGSVSIAQNLPGRLEWPIRTPDGESKLQFQVWLEILGQAKDAYARVEISARNKNGTEKLLYQRLVRGGRHWQKGRRARSAEVVQVPLTEFSGTEVTLSFSASPVLSEDLEAKLVWANPIVKARRETTLPNIVFICVDTLRRDSVDAFRDTGALGLTPSIDRLAKDGVAFTETFSHSPWTLPSVVSVMTGLPPSLHGTGKRLTASPDDAGVATVQRKLELAGKQTQMWRNRGVSRLYSLLDQNIPTIPDLLNDAYESYFVNGKNGWLRAIKLHERFESSHLLVGDDAEAVRLGNRWVEERRDGLFLSYYHLMYAHGWIHSYPSGRMSPERGRFAYQRSVEAADQAVGDVLTNLDRLGLYDEAMIILWSDHGEHLWDKQWPGISGHGEGASNVLLKVPLVVKFPGNKHRGVRENRPVRLLDLFATVLAPSQASAGEVALDIPHALQSRDLGEFLSGEDEITFIPAGFANFDRQFHSVQSQDYRLVYDPDGGSYQLLDLQQDSWVDPTTSEQEAQKVELRESLDDYLQFVDDLGLRARVLELGDDDIENLRTLGYLD